MIRGLCQGNQAVGLGVDREPHAGKPRQQRLHDLENRLGIGHGDRVDLKLERFDRAGLARRAPGGHVDRRENLLDLSHLFRRAGIEEPHSHRVRGDPQRAIGRGIPVGRDVEELPDHRQRLVGHQILEFVDFELPGEQPGGVFDALDDLADRAELPGRLGYGNLLGGRQDDDIALRTDQALDFRFRLGRLELVELENHVDQLKLAPRIQFLLGDRGN